MLLKLVTRRISDRRVLGLIHPDLVGSGQGRFKGAIDRYFASPVGAEGKLWLVSQDGALSVVAARGDWEILSVDPLGDEVFVTPAIAAERIYLRTRSTLYCFGNP